MSPEQSVLPHSPRPSRIRFLLSHYSRTAPTQSPSPPSAANPLTATPTAVGRRLTPHLPPPASRPRHPPGTIWKRRPPRPRRTPARAPPHPARAPQRGEPEAVIWRAVAKGSARRVGPGWWPPESRLPRPRIKPSALHFFSTATAARATAASGELRIIELIAPPGKAVLLHTALLRHLGRPWRQGLRAPAGQGRRAPTGQGRRTEIPTTVEEQA
jgi:hypothetical protein